MKKMKKNLLLVISAVMLLSLGFAAAVSAGSRVMVRCEGMKGESTNCKGGCSVNSSNSKMVTLEECERAGGRPVEVEKTD